MRRAIAGSRGVLARGRQGDGRSSENAPLTAVPGRRAYHAEEQASPDTSGAEVVGTVRRLLDSIVEACGRSNPLLRSTTRTKLILLGLNPNKFDDDTPDDPILIARVHSVARELGVTVKEL